MKSLSKLKNTKKDSFYRVQLKLSQVENGTMKKEDTEIEKRR